ncbi:MAG: ATP synthase F1 subunit delta [Oscillospiraceae bacterium]
MKEVFKEYAEAIYSLAAETHSEDEYLYGMRLINRALKKNPEYAVILDAPSISKSERLSLIDKTFSNDVCEHVLSLLKILCEKGLVGNFGEVYDEFAYMYLYFASAARAKVISAVPLNTTEKKELHSKLEKLSGRVVSVRYEVDPEILGGVIVEIEERIIDGSLRKKLKEIKEVIKQ